MAMRDHDQFLKGIENEFNGYMLQLKISKADKKELWKTVQSEYYAKFGDDSTDLINFENIICIAKK